MKKIDSEIIKERFNKKGLEMIGKFINVDTPVEYRCLIHKDFISKVAPKDINRRAKCKLCNPVKRTKVYNLQSAKKIFKENHLTLLETEYKNYNAPMKFICDCHKEEGVQQISLQALLNRQSSKKRLYLLFK